MQNIRQPILKTCLNMNVFKHFLGVSSHSIGLVGKRVRAHVMSIKSGHPTHCKLAMAMLEQEAKAAAAQ